MSELTYNLQQIYNCKLQIKSAIGTQSDELADYASYITAMKPNGYTYITENGDHSVSGYAYVNVDVPTGSGGDSKDIMNCYTYDIMDPFLDISSSSIRYNGATGSTYCMISSYVFGQKYPAYINAEYVPNKISGNTNAGRSTYVISYMSDEMIDRGLSYNSLPDISEWNGAGFYKGKFNFNSAELDNRHGAMIKTNFNINTVNKNGALFNSEYIGNVTRTDFIYKDNLNDNYLYINAYQSGNSGYYYSTEPMTYGSYILEKYNNAYGFTDMLHNSYNCIVWANTIESGYRNSQIIDIVSWGGEAILPQPVSNVCIKSYSDNSYTQWTDTGTTYTYSLSLNQFQSMNFRAMNGSSYLTCQFGNDEATYYFGLNNLNVYVTDYGSYGYWPNADNNTRTAQWSLLNQIQATVNYNLIVDKNTGKMIITCDEPKHGSYLDYYDSNENVVYSEKMTHNEQLIEYQEEGVYDYSVRFDSNIASSYGATHVGITYYNNNNISSKLYYYYYGSEVNNLVDCTYDNPIECIDEYSQPQDSIYLFDITYVPNGTIHWMEGSTDYLYFTKDNGLYLVTSADIAYYLPFNYTNNSYSLVVNNIDSSNLNKLCYTYNGVDTELLAANQETEVDITFFTNESEGCDFTSSDSGNIAFFTIDSYGTIHIENEDFSSTPMTLQAWFEEDPNSQPGE